MENFFCVPGELPWRGRATRGTWNEFGGIHQGKCETMCCSHSLSWSFSSPWVTFSNLLLLLEMGRVCPRHSVHPFWGCKTMLCQLFIPFVRVTRFWKQKVSFFSRNSRFVALHLVRSSLLSADNRQAGRQAGPVASLTATSCLASLFSSPRRLL